MTKHVSQIHAKLYLVDLRISVHLFDQLTEVKMCFSQLMEKRIPSIRVMSLGDQIGIVVHVESTIRSRIFGGRTADVSGDGGLIVHLQTPHAVLRCTSWFVGILGAVRASSR